MVTSLYLRNEVEEGGGGGFTGFTLSLGKHDFDCISMIFSIYVIWVKILDGIEYQHHA